MFHWAPPDVNGIRRDHFDAFLQQVVPGLDVLRVPGPDGEDHDRVREDPVVVVLVPVRSDHARLDEGVHVRLEGGVEEVGRQPFLDCVPLLARGGVGLLELDACAGVGVLEHRDELLVGLTRRRVGDEGEGAAIAAACGGVGVVAAAAPGGNEDEQRGECRKGAQLGDTSAFSCHYFEYPTFSTG